MFFGTKASQCPLTTSYNRAAKKELFSFFIEQTHFIQTTNKLTFRVRKLWFSTFVCFLKVGKSKIKVSDKMRE